MSRLDDNISTVAYILDTLMAYRQITEKGCCNDCDMRTKCVWKPKPGEIVRYNCPFYKAEKSSV